MRWGKEQEHPRHSVSSQFFFNWNFFQPNDMTSLNRSCWSKCPTPFEYDEDILPPIPDYFTAPFSRDRAKQFVYFIYFFNFSMFIWICLFNCCYFYICVKYVRKQNTLFNILLVMTWCWNVMYTHAFLNVFSYRFIIEDEDNFFSPAERSLLVYQVLERCVFENNTDSSKNKFGVWTFNSFCFVFVLYIANTGEDYFVLYFNQKCFVKKKNASFL